MARRRRAEPSVGSDAQARLVARETWLAERLGGWGDRDGAARHRANAELVAALELADAEVPALVRRLYPAVDGDGL